ncbi:unnamed protein product [Pleuronectes platessa]|uniref:Uncharacterized protein n=1 Tax=Pleuronectes platessa TaxID=8262 RepID=A0A9N7VDK2_PLEPL|nr:unnamed protein product [Pleuronectes platessa]
MGCGEVYQRPERPGSVRLRCSLVEVLHQHVHAAPVCKHPSNGSICQDSPNCPGLASDLRNPGGQKCGTPRLLHSCMSSWAPVICAPGAEPLISRLTVGLARGGADSVPGPPPSPE